MSEESRSFLQKNCPKILEETDLRKFLLKLDDFIVMEGLDSNDNMTAFGHKAQAVYDEIYMCNQ
jgi:hypothetical protein